MLALIASGLAGLALAVYFTCPPLPRSVIQIHEFRGALFSPDGAFIAVVEGDTWEITTIRIVDVDSKKTCFEVPDADSRHTEIAFSLDGRRFATYVRDCLVKVWDFRDGQELCSIPISCDWEGGRPTPRFSADSTHLLLGDSATNNATKFAFWNIASGAKESVFPVSHLSLVDSGRLAVGWENEVEFTVLHLWDIGNPAVPVELVARRLETSSFAFSQDGQSLMQVTSVGDDRERLDRIDMKSGKLIESVLLPCTEWSIGGITANDHVVLYHLSSAMAKMTWSGELRIYGTCIRLTEPFREQLTRPGGHLNLSDDPKDRVVLPNHLEDALDKRLAKYEGACFSPGGNFILIPVSAEHEPFPIPLLETIINSIRDWLGDEEFEAQEFWSTKGRNRVLRLDKCNHNLPIAYANNETRLAECRGNILRIWDLPPRKSASLLLGLVALVVAPLLLLVTSWKSCRPACR